MTEKKESCDLTQAAWNVIKEDEIVNELVSFGAYVAFKRFFECAAFSAGDVERGVISDEAVMKVRERIEDFLESWITDVMLYRFEDSVDCPSLAHKVVKSLYPCLYESRLPSKTPITRGAPVHRPMAVVEV